MKKINNNDPELYSQLMFYSRINECWFEVSRVYTYTLKDIEEYSSLTIYDEIYKNKNGEHVLVCKRQVHFVKSVEHAKAIHHILLGANNGQETSLR